MNEMRKKLEKKFVEHYENLGNHLRCQERLTEQELLWIAADEEEILAYTPGIDIIPKISSYWLFKLSNPPSKTVWPLSTHIHVCAVKV